MRTKAIPGGPQLCPSKGVSNHQNEQCGQPEMTDLGDRQAAVVEPNAQDEKCIS